MNTIFGRPDTFREVWTDEETAALEDAAERCQLMWDERLRILKESGVSAAGQISSGISKDGERAVSTNGSLANGKGPRWEQPRPQVVKGVSAMGKPCLS